MMTQTHLYRLKGAGSGYSFFRKIASTQSVCFWLPILILLLSQLSISFAQNNLVLYNMAHIPQANQLNPGQMPLVKGHLGFPALSGIRAAGTHTGFSYNQWNMADVGQINNFDFSGLQQHLQPEKNQLFTDNEIQILSFGVRMGKGYLSMDIAELGYANLNYTPTIFGMLDDIQQGRLFFDKQDRTYDLSQLELNGAYYRSYSLGYTRQILPDFSIGGRFRWLRGMAGMWTENNNLKLQYFSDGNALQVSGQMELLASGLDNFNFARNFLQLLPGGNSGFAIDFGGVYQVNDHWDLSFSALNLGQIKWKKDVNRQVVADHLGFSIENAEEHLEQWNEIVSDLVDGESPNGEVQFTTSTPQRFFLGSRYHLGRNSSVGVLVNAQRFNTTTDVAVALSANTRLLNFFGLSTSLAYNKYSSFNLGLGISFDLGFLQLYGLTDNLFSALDWENATTAQGQVGLNFTFGKVKRETLPTAKLKVEPAANQVVIDGSKVEEDSVAVSPQALPNEGLSMSKELPAEQEPSEQTRRVDSESNSPAQNKTSMEPPASDKPKPKTISQTFPEKETTKVDLSTGMSLSGAESSKRGEGLNVSQREVEKYSVKENTSMLQGPVHTANVILQLRPGDAVQLVKKTSQWWWKVRTGEKTGYVKAHLLSLD